MASKEAEKLITVHTQKWLWQLQEPEFKCRSTELTVLLRCHKGEDITGNPPQYKSILHNLGREEMLTKGASDIAVHRLRGLPGTMGLKDT